MGNGTEEKPEDSLTWGARAPSPEVAASSNAPFALRGLPALLPPHCTPQRPLCLVLGSAYVFFPVLSMALPALYPQPCSSTSSCRSQPGGAPG